MTSINDTSTDASTTFPASSPNATVLRTSALGSNTPILTEVEPSNGYDISNIAEDIACEVKKASVREVVMITTNEPIVECCKKMREIKQKTNTEIIHIALVCPCYKECDCDKDCKCEKNEKDESSYDRRSVEERRDVGNVVETSDQEIHCCQKWFLPFLFHKL